MYRLQGGDVPVPRWNLGFRLLQLLFALIVLGLTAYGLSILNGGPLRPSLIPLIVVACLTILSCVVATPLHPIQRRFYDPRIALAIDGIAMLFWLGAFAAAASYVHLYRGLYGRGYVALDVADDFELRFCSSCHRAWRSAVAATVFGAFEFLLFLMTTIVFLYYYHRHMMGIPLTSTAGAHKEPGHVSSTIADSKTAPVPGLTGTSHGGSTQHIGPYPLQPMSENPETNHQVGVPDATGTGNRHYTGPHGSLPYPDRPLRGGEYQHNTHPLYGGHGGYNAGSTNGYSTIPTSPNMRYGGQQMG